MVRNCTVPVPNKYACNVLINIVCVESLGDVVTAEIVAEQRWVLTPEGEEVAREGSHEARLFNLVPPAGIPQVR